MGVRLITDVLDVLDRHGYTRGDNEHAGRAIFLIRDLAGIYEGSQAHPFGPAINQHHRNRRHRTLSRYRSARSRTS
jgi:hypothetical protein